ncbi:Nance-Horan syndrome protein [Oryzias melastigma]|uniref:Nance-Horan syndrome protein n=1 Tax=Oryzias melastigma TaxID=30732 RepID=A0A834KXK5_ORYME|nr:Nance-Horan syndrome protein [Oryzias melastigma]
MISYVECLSGEGAGPGVKSHCWNGGPDEERDELLPRKMPALQPKTEGSLRRRLLSAKIHQQHDALLALNTNGGGRPRSALGDRKLPTANIQGLGNSPWHLPPRPHIHPSFTPEVHGKLFHAPEAHEKPNPSFPPTVGQHPSYPIHNGRHQPGANPSYLLPVPPTRNGGNPLKEPQVPPQYHYQPTKRHKTKLFCFKRCRGRGSKQEPLQTTPLLHKDTDRRFQLCVCRCDVTTLTPPDTHTLINNASQLCSAVTLNNITTLRSCLMTSPGCIISRTDQLSDKPTKNTANCPYAHTPTLHLQLTRVPHSQVTFITCSPPRVSVQQQRVVVMVLIGAAIKSVLRYLRKTSGDGDSKWAVHYTTQKPQQGLRFIRGKRQSNSADDLRAFHWPAQQSPGSKPCPSSPTFSPLSGMDQPDGSAHRGWRDRSRKMSSASSDDDERFFLTKGRPMTPLVLNPISLTSCSDGLTPTFESNWDSETDPIQRLPTPEEQMRRQAEAIAADIVPINVTGESFDRQASFRRALSNSDSLSRRSRKLTRRKTVSNLQDDASPKTSVSVDLPGQFSTVGRPASSCGSSSRQKNKEAEVAEGGEMIRTELLSSRRIRAPKGEGMSSLMATLTSSPRIERQPTSETQTQSSPTFNYSSDCDPYKMLGVSSSSCQSLLPHCALASFPPQIPHVIFTNQSALIPTKLA